HAQGRLDVTAPKTGQSLVVSVLNLQALIADLLDLGKGLALLSDLLLQRLLDRIHLLFLEGLEAVDVGAVLRQLLAACRGSLFRGLRGLLSHLFRHTGQSLEHNLAALLQCGLFCGKLILAVDKAVDGAIEIGASKGSIDILQSLVNLIQLSDRARRRGSDKRNPIAKVAELRCAVSGNAS